MSEHRSEVDFVAITIDGCVVELPSNAARYLGPVHRTALELANANMFGEQFGGHWLGTEEIEQLRGLAACYPPDEAALVTVAIEAYLRAQLGSLYSSANRPVQ